MSDLKNPTLYAPAKAPAWKRLAVGTLVTSVVGTGGYVLKDHSPVHFMVEGAPPEAAPDWKCEPEGGIVGAPVVCRYGGPGGDKGAIVPTLPAQPALRQDGQQH